MLYAIDEGKNIVEAEPNRHASCPLCLKRVISKCGDINVWHWAHESRQDCDTWAESETQWHLAWKKLVQPEFCEVTIQNGGISHRADVLGNNATVIELQHSFISPEQIRERERFYGSSMVWVFDLRDCRNNTYHRVGGYSNPVYIPESYYWEHRFQIYKKGDYWSFRWKHPRKHITHTSTQTFLDLGDNLFLLKKMYTDETPYRGWGYL